MLHMILYGHVMTLMSLTLMLSMSDSTDISLVLAFIGFQWLHLGASYYQLCLHKINAYPNATHVAE